jgi:hypothetical protein
MIYLLVAVLVVLMGMTLYSLLRGLNAFRQSLDAGIDAEGATQLQLKQNKMMWARIKYQGAAIVAVVLIMLLAGGR